MACRGINVVKAMRAINGVRNCSQTSMAEAVAEPSNKQSVQARGYPYYGYGHGFNYGQRSGNSHGQGYGPAKQKYGQGHGGVKYSGSSYGKGQPYSDPYAGGFY